LGLEGFLPEDQGFDAEAAVTKTYATGTTVQVGAGYEDLSEGNARERATSLDIEVSQALLQGRGRAVNLARVHQAEIGTQISRYELRGVAEALVASVERAYWGCVLAREKIDIYTKSLEVAQQQIAEVQEQINVGKVAELELAAAAAEVAEKREQLISARGDCWCGCRTPKAGRQLVSTGRARMIPQSKRSRSPRSAVRPD